MAIALPCSSDSNASVSSDTFHIFKICGECNKPVRELITNDLHLGSEPALGRSLISTHLRHKAVFNAKIYGNDNGDN